MTAARTASSPVGAARRAAAATLRALLTFAAAAGAGAAPGDLYRCVDAAGRVSFQDRPCPAGSAARFEGRTDGGERDLRELRQWLGRWRDAPRSSTGGADTGAREAEPAPRQTESTSRRADGRLAACSARFLACADADAARMDACVARIPRCETGGGACCPAECVARYRRLRERGVALATAVRDALLADGAAGCGG